MKSFLLPLLLSMALYAQVEPIADPYAGIEHFRLDNGLEVYLLGDVKSENTSIEISVNVGSDVEDEKTSGLSHLLEHMVFRDGRVPHRDYVDYIQDEGGTYVNGFTTPDKTLYRATINNEKSYWIAKTFARMLFDKNVTETDLVSEKGAVQTEIGEDKLPERLFWKIAAFFRMIMPPSDDFYAQEFGLSRAKEPLAGYYAKQNNGTFTLDEVMRHYKKYYYPANMTLKVVGNFDTARMKKLIYDTFGPYHQSGTATSTKPPERPQLNHKPAFRYYEGVGKNSGYVGAKYLLNDYKKYLIIDAYMANVASRLQKHLRNTLGQNYDVSPYMFDDRKAGVASVYFDGLREHFEENIKIVTARLADDSASLDDKTIDDALREYQENAFASVEHDSESLMSLVDTQEYLNTQSNIKNKSAYGVFKTISHNDFRRVVSEVFTPQNHYAVIYRDYYLFPYDMLVWSLVATLLLILVYFKLYRIDYRAKGLRYTKRDILFERRISNRFLGFLLFLFVFIVSTVLSEWIKYGLSMLLTGDPYYLATVDVPYSYVINVMDALVMIALFAVIYKYGFDYFARIDVDGETLYLVGNNIAVVEKSMVESVGVSPWSPDKFFKIKGLAIAFWRPLTMLTLKNGEKLYLRSSRADHLKEDIEKSWNRTD